MGFQDEIRAIVGDSTMSYKEKREQLLEIVTPQEVRALLPESEVRVALKEPLRAKASGEDMRILNRRGRREIPCAL